MSDTHPTVLLFDIDGTLLNAGGAGRRGLERAFGEACERPDAVDAIRFAGMTDLLIVEQALEAIQHPSSPDLVERLFRLYLAFLEEELRDDPSFLIHPGVSELLDQLRDRPGVALGLGTGNLEAGARIKLERARLNPYFGFGGFGSDHIDRAELIRIGAERGAAQLGLTRDACRVVVIGDTPRDVAAARAIGADVLAVTTGHYEADALDGADRIEDDLQASDLTRWLLG